MLYRPLCTLLFAAALLAPAATAQPAATQDLASEPVTLDTPTGTIHGTLVNPAGEGPHPVALLIAGSGPTDRDGNNALLPGPNDSLKLLAQALAARGIASLRYDKRGIAESAAAAPSEADLRFETYAEDAAAWVRQLRDDDRFTSVTVIGHSEGSLIGMLAADEADAFVSVAGIARPASDVLRTQLRTQLPPDLWDESERILATLKAGETTTDVPQAIFALYRPSVQPYLISWLRYDPAEKIARLDVPVLIAQGTTDIQVGLGEAEALKQAQPEAELLIIEGMNHVLKPVPADPAQQQASYSDPTLPVVPELVERIARFIADS